MKNKRKHLLCGISSFLIAGSLVFASPAGTETVQAASTFRSTEGTVHFLTLPDNTDAILLECDGKFGMVDSGEDNDYPNGSDPRYPLRPGVTRGNGYENRVISYLKEKGVNADNFEFYIGTHPHSDHIGSADEVIRAFHPKRVYIEPYSDNDITDASHLWDNLYVYDHMIAAAKDTGATLIQYFNENAPLYPETVTVKGSIVWTAPEIPDQPDPEPTVTPTPTPESPKDGTDKEQNLNSDTQENAVSGETGTNSSSNPDTDSPSADFSPDNNLDESGISNPDLESIDEMTSDISVNSLSASSEGASIVSLSTASVENDVSAATASEKSNTNASVTPPDKFSVTLTWGKNSEQSVTITSDSISEKGSITQVDANHWNYEFQGIPKYDDNKSEYTYKVAPEATGYIFSNLNNSEYDFQCTTADIDTATAVYTDPATVEDEVTAGGITDDESISTFSAASDGLVTSSIPSSDRVVAGSASDPTNANQDERTVAGKSGVYDGVTGSVSTPVFYLGDKNKLKIEIMNYGVSRPQPDANYYSLGVKVTSLQTGTTAFLSGDINNYNGTETALARKLGHVNLLKLGHHGSYGSNTDGYIRSLNPDMAIMTGTYTYVTNTTVGNECGTRDTLLSMGARGTPLYATGWYSNDVEAFVIHLNSSLSNNIPSGKSLVAAGTIDGSDVAVYYENGYPTNYTGWKQDLWGNYYYFQNSSVPLTNQFVLSNGTWYYVDNSGKMATGWVNSNGTYYYMNPSDGAMVTGWIQLKNIWYYLGSDGAMYTGTHMINGSEYSFTSDGAMVTSAWVGNHYYGADGAWIPNYHNGNWRKDATGYWYVLPDGSYPVNKWEKIDGKWYYFDGRGYMVTGWLHLGSTWYYLNADGSMHIGWLKLGNNTYYTDNSGAMITGWGYISNSWYYFDGSGAMYGAGWHVINSKYYYMYSGGNMAANTWIGDYYVDGSGAWIPGKARYSTGWILSGSRWWYRHQDGSYTRNGWEYINGKWYFFDQDGWMVTGWLKRGNTWYYLTGSGAMATGWINLGGTWYYLNSSGAMAANTWIGSYYVNGSGAWVPSQLKAQTGWILSGSRWWYRHQDGSYTRNGWEYINGKWYFFDQDGWMATGWLKRGNTWYYLTGSGAMATGWINLGGTWYYLTGSGAMASNTRIGSYYVNSSGAWLPGV